MTGLSVAIVILVLCTLTLAAWMATRARAHGATLNDIHQLRNDARRWRARAATDPTVTVAQRNDLRRSAAEADSLAAQLAADIAGRTVSHVRPTRCPYDWETDQ
jgi:hypothetical protein